MIKEFIQSLRSPQLNKLKDGLFSSGATAKPQCFLIEGSPGIGRKSLVNQLREELDGENEQILWLDPSRLRDEPDLQKYHNLIPQCIKTNIPLLKSRADQAAIEIGREMHKVDAQAMQSSGGTEKKDQKSLSQVWGRVFKEHFLSSDGEDADETKAIVLFENFETYNGQQQLWMKEFLIDQLQETCPGDHITFIVTTTPEESKNVQKFFPGGKYENNNLSVEPLTESDIEELLLQVSLPEVSVEEFYERTKGIPSKIEDLANSLLNAELDESAVSSIEAFMTGKTNEQIQWITAAVHLPECTEEGFRLYFDEDTAVKALSWIREQPQLISQSATGECAFNEELKTALIRWMRQADPDQFKTLSEISAKYTKIVRKFSDSESRTYLDHLACLNYFSSEDLEYLFNGSAEDYIQFIERNPQYFEQGVGKQKVQEKYQQLVESYRELVPSTISETLHSKASDFWNQKSADLVVQKKSLKAKKSLEEAKLGELLDQRSTLEIFLEKDDEEKEAQELEEEKKAEHLKRIQEEKQAEVERRVKRSRLIHTLLNATLLIIGIASFYFGIFSKDTKILPCTFGVALIALGVFRPFRQKVTIKTSKIESKVEKSEVKEEKKAKTASKKKKGKKAEPEAPATEVAPPAEEVLLPEESGARYILEFKREKISSREEEIQSRIEELNKTLKEVEQMLAEPLVA